MTNRFPGKNCVLCSNPSVGVGEHVWPSWLIKKFHGQGPFYTEKGGVPIKKSDGVTRHPMSALPSIHVPMCGLCNTLLSSTVEIPAKVTIERLAPWSEEPFTPLLNAGESAALARWFLKVGLLSAHPEAVHDNPLIQKDPDRFRFGHVELAWLDWMRTGTPPPNGFSVYATRRSVQDEQPHDGEQLHLMVPSVQVDERNLGYMIRSFGIRGLDVTIVWHPSWPIRHPLVETGRAIRLWPCPSAVDLSGLPVVNPKEFQFAYGESATFTEAIFRQAIKVPLSLETDLVNAQLGDFS